MFDNDIFQVVQCLVLKFKEMTVKYFEFYWLTIKNVKNYFQIDV